MIEASPETQINYSSLTQISTSLNHPPLNVDTNWTLAPVGGWKEAITTIYLEIVMHPCGLQHTSPLHQEKQTESITTLAYHWFSITTLVIHITLLITITLFSL